MGFRKFNRILNQIDHDLLNSHLVNNYVWIVLFL